MSLFSYRKKSVWEQIPTYFDLDLAERKNPNLYKILLAIISHPPIGAHEYQNKSNTQARGYRLPLSVLLWLERLVLVVVAVVCWLHGCIKRLSVVAVVVGLLTAASTASVLLLWDSTTVSTASVLLGGLHCSIDRLCVVVAVVGGNPPPCKPHLCCAVVVEPLVLVLVVVAVVCWLHGCIKRLSVVAVVVGLLTAALTAFVLLLWDSTAVSTASVLLGGLHCSINRLCVVVAVVRETPLLHQPPLCCCRGNSNAV